jgi:pyrroloquinoline-quinone synthase
MKTEKRLKVTRAADEILDRTGILTNPYFTALQDGTMTLEAFRRGQEQFYFAVLFFARPMAALVARIPDPRSRLDILHNVVEEHGEFHSQDFHATTFKKFLRTVGADPERLERLPLWPGVRAFNSVLATACLLDELDTGISCMGIIEYAFADISAVIGRTVVERGWVRPQRLVHYKLHAAIDKRHAREFFALIESAWNDRRRRYYVEQGLEMGAYVFDRLYRDLWSMAGQGKSAGRTSRPHQRRELAA